MDLLVFIYTLVKVIFIIVDVILLVLTIYALKEGWKFRPHLWSHAAHSHATTAPHAAVDARQKMVKDRWAVLSKKFEDTISNDSRKVAIIEADKLVDNLLKDSGFEGKSMADRLEQLSPEKVTTLNRLWRAHRLRNEIVHSPDFEVSPSLAERTMEDYEAFLREVKLLEG